LFIKFMGDNFERFLISQVAVFIRNDKCLIGEFSSKPGLWGLPGGRIDIKEGSEEAFKREIKEELGLDNFDVLGIVDAEAWYRPDGMPMSAVVRLIKNDTDEIKISPENIRFKWVGEDELEDYNFLWFNAKRMIKNGFKYYRLLNNEK